VAFASQVFVGDSFAAAVPWMAANRARVRSVTLAGVSATGAAASALPSWLPLLPLALWPVWPVSQLLLVHVQQHACTTADLPLLQDYALLSVRRLLKEFSFFLFFSFFFLSPLTRW
jgi:hypothetical protein